MLPIDGSEHLIARDQKGLERQDALLRHSHQPMSLTFVINYDGRERLIQALTIYSVCVRYAAVVTVTTKMVALVCVNLTLYYRLQNFTVDFASHRNNVVLISDLDFAGQYLSHSIKQRHDLGVSGTPMARYHTAHL